MSGVAKNQGGDNRRWESSDAVEAWRKIATVRVQVLAAATESMLDLAGVVSGASVLDVAAGSGDQTLAAAHRVGPTGSVLATDISDGMLQSAQEAARQAGLGNVMTRVMDVESLALAPGSVDAVICRMGLMLFPNVQRALTKIHQVLKPSGRFAALVFSVPDKNPFFSIPATIIRRSGNLPMLKIGEQGEWALSSPVVFGDALKVAGFYDVTVDNILLSYRFASMTDVMAFQRNMVDNMHLMNRLDETQREPTWSEIKEALRPFEVPTGVEIPGELLLGGGTK